MDWQEYKNNYIKMAKIENKLEEYWIEQLNYAKNLFDNNFPIIYNQEHLCKLVGYKPEYVYSASNQPKSFYRTFYIPKKNGKKRKIDEPLPSLKEIQYWILEEILYNDKISPYAKAYIKGKSVKDNARFHKNQKKVLTIDIKDFFPSIKYPRVLNVFRRIGYREDVCVMLANLCCLNGCLPQGAPTSPYLSNIIASTLDYKIMSYIGNRKIRYTRYADDLTFSGDFDEGIFINDIKTILYKQGFYVNEKKIRVRKNHQQQEVTGIIVNKKMQVAKRIRHKLRSDAYYIEKYGIKSHIEHLNENGNNYLYKLIGLASYAHFINPKDKNIEKYLNIFRNELKNNDNML